MQASRPGEGKNRAASGPNATGFAGLLAAATLLAALIWPIGVGANEGPKDQALHVPQSDSGGDGSLLKILAPSAVFLQSGVGDDRTSAYLIGAAWDLPWRHEYSFGVLNAYFETSFGRWATRTAPSGIAWLTQVGITPVFRLYPTGQGDWFGEIGVGGNLILPVYRSREKRFSTEFNFGDHAAIGRHFGERRKQELVLRFEHFSNAGIDEPNPGENLLQLRYLLRF